MFNVPAKFLADLLAYIEADTLARSITTLMISCLRLPEQVEDFIYLIRVDAYALIYHRYFEHDV